MTVTKTFHHGVPHSLVIPSYGIDNFINVQNINMYYIMNDSSAHKLLLINDENINLIKRSYRSAQMSL